MTAKAEHSRTGAPTGGWEAIGEVRAGSQPRAGSASDDPVSAQTSAGERGSRSIGTTRSAAASVANRPVVRRLRAASFGTVADEGGRAVRRYGRFLLLSAAVLTIPRAVLDVLAANAAYDALADDNGVFASFTPLFSDNALGIGEVQAVFTVVLTSLMVALMGALTADVVETHQMVGEVVPRDALRRTARALPRIIAAWFLSHLPWTLALLAVANTSSDRGGAVFLGFLAVPFMVWWMFVIPVVVIERVGPMQALRRAARLGKSVFFTSLMWVLLSCLFWFVMWLGLQWIPEVLDYLLPVGQGRWTWLTRGVASTVTTIITMPIVAAVTAMFYIDARIRVEGLDLTLEAERVFADVVPVIDR